MVDSRWQVISDRIKTGNPGLSIDQRVCAVTRDIFQAQSVSMAMVVQHSYRPIAATDDLGTFLDDEQFALGDGPTFDAQTSPIPIVLEDARSARAKRRWTVFANLAAKHEIAGVFAFPLRVGEAYLGVLSIYCTLAGEPTADRYSDGLILASIATAELIRRAAAIGPASDMTVLEPGLYDESSLQIAAGMVAESLNVSIVAALARIRARAFSDDKPVSATAQLIVDRQLVLER